MQSGAIEPDTEATLMMAICERLKVQHRLIFRGDNNPSFPGTFYRCEFQVAEACDPTGWITMKDTPALVSWLARK